jgi:hypothetical protein
VFDKSIYCRAKVLEIFRVLNDSDLLPRYRFNPILKIATARLRDQGAIVRKAAAAVIESLIYKNKFQNPSNEIRFESKSELQEQMEVQSNKMKVMKEVLEGNMENAGSLAGIEESDPEELKNHITKQDLVINYLMEYIDMLEVFDVVVKDLY